MTTSLSSQDSPATTSGSPQPRVLIVDDEHGVLKSLRRMLRKEKFTVTFTDSPQQVLEWLRRESFAVMISDLRMPEVPGAYLLLKAREISPDTIRILLSGYGDPETITETINRGIVSSFISKPWNDDDLRTIIRQAVAQFTLRKQNEHRWATSSGRSWTASSGPFTSDAST